MYKTLSESIGVIWVFYILTRKKAQSTDGHTQWNAIAASSLHSEPTIDDHCCCCSDKASLASMPLMLTLAATSIQKSGVLDVDASCLGHWPPGEEQSPRGCNYRPTDLANSPFYSTPPHTSDSAWYSFAIIIMTLSCTSTAYRLWCGGVA